MFLLKARLFVGIFLPLLERELLLYESTIFGHEIADDPEREKSDTDGDRDTRDNH